MPVIWDILSTVVPVSSRRKTSNRFPILIINGETKVELIEDVPGFCASVPVSRVAELDYVLTPGRYVGLPEEEDDFNFEERFTALKAEFEAQLKEEERLNKLILENLAKIQ